MIDTDIKVARFMMPPAHAQRGCSDYLTHRRIGHMSFGFTRMPGAEVDVVSGYLPPVVMLPLKKLIRAWVASQKGMFFEAPQRQRVTRLRRS